jgi:hypothetical protein
VQAQPTATELIRVCSCGALPTMRATSIAARSRESQARVAHSARGQDGASPTARPPEWRVAAAALLAMPAVRAAAGPAGGGRDEPGHVPEAGTAAAEDRPEYLGLSAMVHSR